MRPDRRRPKPDPQCYRHRYIIEEVDWERKRPPDRHESSTPEALREPHTGGSRESAATSERAGLSAAETPAIGSTLTFIRFLMQSYPRQTAWTTVLIALSSAAEALSVATLVPVLNTAIRIDGTLDDSNPVERLTGALLQWAGVPYTLTTLLLLVAVLMAGKGLFQWLALRAGGRAMAHIATDFRLRTVSNLFRARWSFILEQRIGALATAVGHETYVTAHAYLAMCQLFAAASLAVVYAAVIATVSLRALGLTVLVGVVLVAPLRYVLRWAHDIAEREARSQQRFVGNLLNAVQSLKPIRAMGTEDSFEGLARADAHELRTSIVRQISLTYLMPAVQEPILVFGIFLFVLSGSYFVHLDLPTMAIIVFGLWRCGNQINFANRFYGEIVVATPFYRQLQQMMATSLAAREVDAGTREVPSAPFTIDVDGVSFAHGDARILENLTMQFPAGAITAIVGASGAGKSTLIDLLLAFQRPDAGRLLVNGVALSDISVRAWRRSLGYVPQETTLFHGTVLQNVTMGDASVSAADVHLALEAAGAAVFVNELEQGVDTMVGEQGARLSGGQRQRIAIARALARRPALLLLDEFTASLDPVTQSAVIRSITSQRPAVTIVIVTHQAALVDIADVVYEIDAGRAIKRTHATP